MKSNALELIGNTSIINLKNLNPNLFVKLESKNPGASIKDRAVLGMIEGMEKRNEIKKGDTIIEGSSGNTGISLSMVGKIKGYKVIIAMPESMSKERRDIIRAYGAELILTEAAKGMQGTLDKVEELKAANPEYKILDQFNNFDNSAFHYATTGPEIFDELNDIDIFVAGVGTGGTISGVGKFLKEKNKDIKIIAVEPTTSPMLSEGKAGPHKIQGIGANFIPKIYDKTVIDDIFLVSSEEAFDTVKKVSTAEGLILGISSGANIFAALELSKKYPGKKIATVSPDDISKYLSMDIFQAEDN